MIVRKLALTASVTIYFGACCYAESPQTAGEFLLNRQREIPTPSVQFCEKELPLRLDNFENALKRLRHVVEVATAPLNQKLSGFLSDPMPRDLNFPTSPDMELLATGRRIGAAAFCPNLLGTMENATVEGLRSTIEQEYSRLLEHADQVR